MSYNTIAAMAQDADLKLRITACAAEQNAKNPEWWADNHAWQVAATPGWDDAYEYAVLNNVERPGHDETVITDGMILAAIQPMILAVPAP